MPEIKGKGIPTRQTVGALGDTYIDTITGIKYRCTGAYSTTTHTGTVKEYEWKAANPVFKNLQRTAEEKPHETPKPKKAKAKVAEKVDEKKDEERPVEKAAEPVKETVNSQAPEKELKGNNQHNYTKHFEESKKAE